MVLHILFDPFVKCSSNVNLLSGMLYKADPDPDSDLQKKRTPDL